MRFRLIFENFLRRNLHRTDLFNLSPMIPVHLTGERKRVEGSGVNLEMDVGTTSGHGHTKVHGHVRALYFKSGVCVSSVSLATLFSQQRCVHERHIHLLSCPFFFYRINDCEGGTQGDV